MWLVTVILTIFKSGQGIILSDKNWPVRIVIVESLWLVTIAYFLIFVTRYFALTRSEKWLKWQKVTSHNHQSFKFWLVTKVDIKIFVTRYFQSDQMFKWSGKWAKCNIVTSQNYEKGTILTSQNCYFYDFCDYIISHWPDV